MAGRPGLELHNLRAIAIPSRWPEVGAYAAGLRLATQERDELPMLLRSGGSIAHALEGDELAALLGLRADTFERWFLLGWSRAAGDEEE